MGKVNVTSWGATMSALIPSGGKTNAGPGQLARVTPRSVPFVQPAVQEIMGPGIR